ncbi:MAG: phenylalanine--tRNA ligase subunit beta [Ureaplasma sp.]|nr:phenylalanine--tRNA ligase subunit beta [Ureaplasma sp.]
MFVSKKLLTLINPNFSAINNNNLISAFNAIGVEVEQIIENKISNDLVLGRLIDFTMHPNSDHLKICNVVVNEKKYQIICGADDLKPNQWVVVALDGAHLNKDLVIREREIRGVKSQGMLCGFEEIISINHNCVSNYDKKTIIQIPYEYQINQNTFFDDFNFNDIIFEVSISSNRPELNGIYFLAYELNLQFNFNVEKINPTIKSIFDFKKKNNVTIEIDSSINVKYNLLSAKVLKEFNEWKIKLILLNSAIKNYNKYDDVCSFITLLFAQPIIAINKKNILNNLIVTTLKNDLEFIDSKQVTHQLKIGTVVTMNANHEIVSVTGRYTNLKYAIDDNTEEVYFEIAKFDTYYAQRQNSLNNFNDNIAFLLAKNTSPNIILMIISYLKKYQKIFALNEVIPIICQRIEKTKSIKIKNKNLLKFIGIDLNYYSIFLILKKIGIIYFCNKAKLPIYRNDLNTLADIAEEIIKNYDINSLPANPFSYATNNFKLINDSEKYSSFINYLINKGLFEVKTYNLTNKESLSSFNWFTEENEGIEINNYQSKNHCVLRKNMVNSLLEVIGNNIKRNRDLLNIFEIQKIQINQEETNDILNCIFTTNIYNKTFNNDNISSNDYSVRSIANGIFEIKNAKLIQEFNLDKFSELDSANNTYYYYKNEFIGVVGKIKQNILNKYDIKSPTYCICINLTKLSKIEENQFELKKISNFNPIYKSITFSNPNNILLDDVIDSLKANDYINDVTLIDVFEKNNVKSYTLSISIQPKNNNLTNDEINNIFWNAIETIRKMQLIIKES